MEIRHPLVFHPPHTSPSPYYYTRDYSVINTRPGTAMGCLLGLYFALVCLFVCLRFHFRARLLLCPRFLAASCRRYFWRAVIILFPFLFSLDNNPVCLIVSAKVDRLILKKGKKKKNRCSTSASQPGAALIERR